MGKKFKIGIVLTVVSLLLLVTSAALAFTQLAKNNPQLIANNVVNAPIATAQYLFWLDNRNANQAIYGYSLDKAAEFLVTAKTGSKLGLMSNDRRLVWVQTPSVNGLSNATIQAYDLQTANETTLVPAGTGEYADLALDGDMLYYCDNAPTHKGLFELDLVTKQERLVSQNGRKPIAANQTLLWLEETYRGQYLPSEWSLYLRKAQNVKLLSKNDGQFEVSLSGTKVVWAAQTPASDQRVYLYNLSEDTTKVLSSQAGYDPHIDGNKVVWVEPSGDASGVNAVLLFDLTTNSRATLIKPSTAKIQVHGIIVQSLLAFTVKSEQSKVTSELYVVGLEQRELEFKAVPINNSPTNGANAALTPVSCGQVYKQGYHLYDCEGRFRVNGVQFILPQRGINGSTFWDVNYNSSLPDIDYWLGVTRDYLQARMVRIFVDMPGASGGGVTSAATVLDFARRANNYGLRVGLVLHNDTTWTLTDARKQWLSDLITLFKGQAALPLIAYINADNEINNHCGSSPFDCFDNNPTYVTNATQWVVNFTQYIKSLDGNILVTVGITTEKPDGDAVPAVADFFRSSGNVPSMAATVDFLAPHNYGGGGYGVWSTLRYDLAYAGPIVLEEYGYPTDLLASNSFFTEGLPLCRTDPLDNACKNTAPFFLEINARAIRENVFDGFTGGSAWMLVDSTSKSCSSPSDFFTGLFASGSYPVCSGVRGTSSINQGQAKATAFRLQLHHIGYLSEPGKSLLVVTNPNDTGVTTQPGTLAYAFSKATSGQIIVLVPKDTNQILVSGILPPVAAGVKILGGCLNGQPTITINGQGTPPSAYGLVLGEGANLEGVRVTKFSGTQVKFVKGYSKLKCTVIQP